MRDEAYPDEDSPRGDPAATPRRYGRVTTHLIGSHHARIRWSGWQLRLRRAIAFDWSWSWPGVERSAANRRVVKTVEGIPPEVVAANLRDRKRTPTTVEIETTPTDACPFNECDGGGKVSYVEREPENTSRPIGHGLSLGPATTYGSRLCRCRWELEPRPGEAGWWVSKKIYEAEWESSVHRHEGSIVVDAEVPVSRDGNYIVEKRGNRYYPTTIDLDLSEDWAHSLFPDEARDLASKLIAAADAADAYDLPDTTEGGTWWFPEPLDIDAMAAEDGIPF